MQNIFKTALYDLKRVFKTDDTRFIILVGLKVSLISFLITFFIYYFLFQILRVNYAFFKANGFPDLQENNPFYDYIMSEAIQNLTSIFGFHVFLFFIGCYIGWLILRPFRLLGEFCENAMENSNAIYKVEDFATYRLLTRFSEFFFEFLRDSRKKQQVLPNSIPPQYSRVHKPVIDRVFMLHFGLLLIVISLISALFIIDSASSIYESMVELATKTLKNHNAVGAFFNQQMFVLDEVVNMTVFFITLFYILLGFHLYSKVSGAAFAIFSTMRSFMKGNHSSRVHIIGNTYLREYTRKLNKYLEFAENKFSKDKPK